MNKNTQTNLMQKRFIVIADYPDSLFQIGEIINSNYIVTTKFGTFAYTDDYPHLFSELQWWEHREESEMPEYAKVHSTEIHKVRKWTIFKTHAIANTLDGTIQYDFNASESTPATEDEYNEFKNK